MPFTISRFAEKLRELQSSLGSTWQIVSAETGISASRLESLAGASENPSGDEILILADYFRCEFTWLMEDDARNPDENLRAMFRLEAGRLSPEDRHSINEFLYLCKCEALLEELLHIRAEKERFSYPPQSGIYVSQGKQCALALRDYYEIGSTGIVPDIFHWLRKEGFRVFRRKLSGSSISGLFVDHPTAGRCIMINADEDVYRQRFVVTEYVRYECLDRRRSRQNSGDAEIMGVLRTNLQAGRFSVAKLDIDDLREVARINSIRQLGKGELSCLVLAWKMRQNESSMLVSMKSFICCPHVSEERPPVHPMHH